MQRELLKKPGSSGCAVRTGANQAIEAMGGTVLRHELWLPAASREDDDPTNDDVPTQFASTPIPTTKISHGYDLGFCSFRIEGIEPLEELALAWPRLEAGDGVTMDLVLNCVTEFQGGGDYVIARFVSTVENAPIAFDVKIDCPNGVPNYDSDTMECRATIELLSDGLAVR